MSTITREHIANLIEFNSEGSDCQANAEQWEVHELARIALASLEAEAVAGEARFKEERHWSPCTAAHVAMVMDNPSDWPNYEVRYLYTAPPAPQQTKE